MKMDSMAELVMDVDPEGLALWNYGKGRRRLRRLGVGGRPFQVQKMTRTLLQCYGVHLEAPVARHWISAPLLLTLSVTLAKIKTLPRKMEVISACQRGVLFQTLKHFVKKKKKKWDPGEGRKKGAVSGEEVTRFMKSELLKVVLGTVSRGSAGY